MVKKMSKVDGRQEFLFAQDYIRRNETNLVIRLLIKLLETNYRLQSAYEIAYYYFLLEDMEKAQPYFNLLLKEEKNIEKIRNIKRMQLYLLAKEEKIERLQEDYFERQIVSYKPEELISFLKQHRIASNKKYEDGKLFYFICLNELIEKVSKHLNKEKVNYHYDALDEYYLTLTNIGVIDGEIAPILNATIIHNTTNIVDLKPAALNRRKQIIKCD